MILESVKLDANTQIYVSLFLTVILFKRQKISMTWGSLFWYIMTECRRLKNVENIKISAKRKSNNPNGIALRTTLPPAMFGVDGSLPLVIFLELCVVSNLSLKTWTCLFSSLKTHTLLVKTKLCYIKSQLFKWINQMWSEVLHW